MTDPMKSLGSYTSRYFAKLRLRNFAKRREKRLPKQSTLSDSNSAGLSVAALALACLFNFGPAAGAEPDQSALELYGIRLLQTGSRLRNYPEEAFREKLSGTAVVVLSIGADGQLERQMLFRSTGHAVLDEHAMAMLARAVPATEIPSNLRNTAFTIQVSVVFALP